MRELVQHLLARARVRFEVRGGAAVVAAFMALAVAFELTAFEATFGEVDGLQRHHRIARAGAAEDTGQGPIGDQNPLFLHDESFQREGTQSSTGGCAHC
ncbi:hypothetical protein D9M68_936010 [compost metagenome]